MKRLSPRVLTHLARCARERQGTLGVRCAHGPACAALTLVLLAGAAAAPALAQDAQPAPANGPADDSPEEFRPIVDVRFEGLERVREQLVRNTIRAQTGQPFRAAVVREDIQRLSRLGQFETIEAVVESADDGVIVVYRLGEAPVIQDVAVSGNRAISDQDISARVNLIAGVPVDEYQLGRAVRAIQDLYRSRGYYLVDVTVDERELAESGVVLFRIREGGRIRVSDIRFDGNESFTPRELRSAVRTRTVGILSKAPLETDTIESDVASLVRYYRDRGYLDVRVDRRITPSPDGREAIVTFVIDEGRIYTMRDVRVESAREGTDLEIDREQAIGLMQVKPGDVFSLQRVRESVQAVQEAYWKLGFADARLRFEELRVPSDDPGVGFVDLLLIVNQGQRQRTGEILIQGNDITKDKVIRRELQRAHVRPERPLDPGAIRQAERRIESTRLFQAIPPNNPKITVLPEDPQFPGYRDLLVEVEETNTGAVTFLAAVGSDSGLIGSISLTQDNFDIANPPTSFDEFLRGRSFRGGGQEFNLTIAPGTRIQTYSLSLSEPYLFETPLALTGQVFLRDRVYSEYDEHRYGFRTTLGRRFGERWTAGLMTRVDSIQLSDIDDDAPVDIFEVEDRNLLTGLGIEVTRTTVPFAERFTPSRGTRVVLRAEQVGALGGDFSFTKLDAEHSLFLPVAEDFLGRRTVLSFTTRAAYIPQENEAPVYERYYLGGRSFRGFDFRTVSPRGVQRNGDPADEPIGGEFLFFFGTQIEKPVWRDVLSVVGFVDTGTVLDSPGFDDYRLSVGFGVRLRIPQLSNAPLAFDFGFPILREPDDERQLFSFSIDLPF